MKRSGPPRRTPVRPSTKPLKRSELPRARTRIRSTGKPRFKGRVDEAYREYIRGLSCVLRWCRAHICLGAVQCCHIKSRSTGGADIGNAFPGCAVAHGRQHEMGIKSFQDYYDIDLKVLAKKYADDWRATRT